MRIEAKAAAKQTASGCGLVAVVLAGAIVLIVVFGMIMTGISSITENNDNNDYLLDRDLTGWEIVATPDVLEKIDINMTYEEVRDIIGGDGKLTYEKSNYQTYSWPGEYYHSKYGSYFCRLDVDFWTDTDEGDHNEPKVGMIKEMEIIEGKEASETREIYSSLEWERLDTVIVSKEQVLKLSEGMDYNQVCELLGGPGKVGESNTTIKDYGTFTTKQYYWRAKHNEYDTYIYISFNNGIVKYLYDGQAEYID